MPHGGFNYDAPGDFPEIWRILENFCKNRRITAFFAKYRDIV